MTKQKETLHVGIDLGTSRSSISASSGGRHVVESYVGWPVDTVARKIVKRSVLFGREALENRPMEMHVYLANVGGAPAPRAEIAAMAWVGADGGIDSVGAAAKQRLSRNLEQDPVVARRDRLAGRRGSFRARRGLRACRHRVAHSSSPSP